MLEMVSSTFQSKYSSWSIILRLHKLVQWYAVNRMEWELSIYEGWIAVAQHSSVPSNIFWGIVNYAQKINGDTKWP